MNHQEKDFYIDFDNLELGDELTLATTQWWAKKKGLT